MTVDDPTGRDPRQALIDTNLAVSGMTMAAAAAAAAAAVVVVVVAAAAAGIIEIEKTAAVSRHLLPTSIDTYQGRMLVASPHRSTIPYPIL